MQLEALRDSTLFDNFKFKFECSSNQDTMSSLKTSLVMLHGIFAIYSFVNAMTLNQKGVLTVVHAVPLPSNDIVGNARPFLTFLATGKHTSVRAMYTYNNVHTADSSSESEQPCATP